MNDADQPSADDRSTQDVAVGDRASWAREVCRHLNELPADQRTAIRLAYFSPSTTHDAPRRIDGGVGRAPRALAAALQTVGLRLETRRGRG